jgi:hypothetical protein
VGGFAALPVVALLCVCPSAPALPQQETARPPQVSQDADDRAREAARRRQDAAREEKPDRRTMFVRRLLVDAGVGIEDRYRRPLVGAGVHLAFLKVGKFFIGAPGVMVASAPEWVEARVLLMGDGQRPPQRTTQMVLERRVVTLLTQSFSWELLARPYGYLYISFVVTKRVPVVASGWDPAVAISFTPR